MATWISLSLLLLALLIFLYLKQLWSRRHFPPGPLSLPIIGSAWIFASKPDVHSVIKYAKRYGNIFTLWFGNHPVVVLSGYKTVKEGLTRFSAEFNGRQESPYFLAFAKRKGILLSSGHVWKQQRQISVTAFRRLGLGKKSIELQIEEGARQLVEILMQTKGQPLDPYFPIINTVTNVVCALSFGHQFPLEDERFQKLVRGLDVAMKSTASRYHLLFDLFPWLMERIPGPHRETLDFSDFVVSFAKQEIQKHKEYHSLHEPQDFIDHYLLQMEKSRNQPNSTYDEENLAHCVLDFFMAGTETTYSSLQWALKVLTNRPQIQAKVHKEIEDIFGASGPISYQDRRKLPYTQAVIHEIQRFKYVLLVGVPRRCVKDAKMNGYHIPKGTAIITDLRSVLHDPEQWETPEEFNPNHFLDKDGQFKTREAYLPFGGGERVCVGEQLARTEIFILLTSLLRAFRFQWPEGVKEVDETPIASLATQSDRYKICAIPYERSS